MYRSAVNAGIFSPLYVLAYAVLVTPCITYAGVFKCVNDGRVGYSSSPCSSGNVPYNRSRISIAESGASSVTLVRDATGGFSVPGAINGVSTNFTVDTGASVTTLSGDYAYKLGIQSCVPVGVSHTANGDTATCSVTVSTLSFGGFNYSNVTVYINPTMRGVTLLGNDLLSAFKIHHENNVMVLSK
ncbi:MAG: retropepsin-like aspartic protease [Gallionella sp.]